MNESFVVEVGRHALQVALMASAPMLAASLIVGVIVSLFQAVTSIQDATLSFVPKILAIAAAILLFGSWILGQLLDFARQMLTASSWGLS